ncbi:MAG TPA: universal stress protein, partial [Terriglobales bacterium]|nr:universal stress protein [Terriglobales bacterium]
MKGRYMRILIPTDGSREAMATMRAATRFLADGVRQVDVLYVTPQLHFSGSHAHGETARARAAAETRRILYQAKRALAEEGLDALTLCRMGSPSRVILSEANNYDVTIIAARGCNTRSEIGLGPVASRVVEHAPGCVLIAREPRENKGTRILVPIDASDGARNALDALCSLVDLGSAEITLMHVMETLWLRAGLERELSGDIDPEAAAADPEAQFARDLRADADKLLLAARGRLLGEHSGVTTSVRDGNPANEILSEADQGDYDLVVIGASGAKDMKHSILGSVSTK